MASGPWYCYILRNTQQQYSHLIYNGSTNNPHRRLRQHNQEIVGGAKYTRTLVKGGWEIYALLTGFPDHRNALSCEWRIKHPSGRPGKLDKQYKGIEGRIRGLNEVLKLDQWTKQCEVKNCDMRLTLYIAEDIMDLIERPKLGYNIIIQKGIPCLKSLNPL